MIEIPPRADHPIGLEAAGIRYGFRFDPMDWINTDRSALAARIRKLVFRQPLERDEDLLAADLEALLDKQDVTDAIASPSGPEMLFLVGGACSSPMSRCAGRCATTTRGAGTACTPSTSGDDRQSGVRGTCAGRGVRRSRDASQRQGDLHVPADLASRSLAFGGDATGTNATVRGRRPPLPGHAHPAPHRLRDRPVRLPAAVWGQRAGDSSAGAGRADRQRLHGGSGGG